MGGIFADLKQIYTDKLKGCSLMVEHWSPKPTVPRSSRGTPAKIVNTGGVHLYHSWGVILSVILIVI